MHKSYVLTAHCYKTGNGFAYTPCLLGNSFNPENMTLIFRLLRADKSVVYYGLMDPDSLKHAAQYDYENYCGCRATEIFVNGKWVEI